MSDKLCTKCNQVKPLDQFSRTCRSLDGYQGWCKSCTSKYLREYYKRNRTELLDYHKQYREDNAEKKLAQKRKHYKANREVILEQQRVYRSLNAEEKAERDRQCYAQNRDRRREQHRLYYQKHRDIFKQSRRRYRARKAGAEGSFTTAEFEALCEGYGNQCLACSSTEMLVPDHVIPLSKGGTNTIDNIQPLCHSCNSKKHTKCTDYRKGENNGTEG